MIGLLTLIISSIIYILFVTTLAREVNSLDTKYLSRSFELNQPQKLSVFEETVSAFLLLPNLTKSNDRLLIKVDSSQNQTKVVTLRYFLFNVFLDILFPIAAIFIVGFVVNVFATRFQKHKLSQILLPMCDKADGISALLGHEKIENSSYSALSRLDKTIEELAKHAKNFQSSSEKNAYRDKLTKLANRHKFLEHINEQINVDNATEQKSALLFVDLDGFKQVNDSFGHSFGDEVLIQVAERLKSVVRSQNLHFREDESEIEYNLARLGGDEFTIFVQSLEHSEHAIDIAKHVLKELERDFVLGNKIIKISASIGIAVYPDSANSPESLVQMADVAMYRAKNDGRGIYRIYSPEMGNKMRRYHYLLEEMRLSIASNSFYLSFQPIINVDGCAISYFEALVRWQHPAEGTISPAEFIPIAEDSNLILELGDWILYEACRQMAAWYNAGMKKTKISINISAIQLKHKPIHEWIMSALAKTGLPPTSLMLEITESCFFDVSKNITDELEKLRQEGVLIAIDDFGTGFSSLAVLANLPVDVLKIDRLFVAEATKNKKYHKIIQSIAELSERLNLKVVAEGIEQIEQLELLKSLGIVYIQGYLISRPESSVNVGNKVLEQGINQMANMGTGIWPPQKTRVINTTTTFID